VQNVDVKVKDQLLTIEAKAQKQEHKAGGDDGLESFTMSSYSQALTLPGPVRVEQMQVERKEGMLVITLPKLNV
jgi:HSP20 family molecular chaperone IbpA